MMRLLNVVIALGCLAWTPVLRADDTAEIRLLIPAATGMSHKDFTALASSTSLPKASDFDDKSLTLLLFALPASDKEEAKKEFRFVTDRIPKPAKLAAEAYRGGVIRKLLPNSPITFLHDDRVTDVTCKVKDDTATGVISFKAPSLYEGKVNYKAIRKSGKWQIAELMMPANKIHIVRDEKGVWRKK